MTCASKIVHTARRLRYLMPRPVRPAILMYHRIGEDSFDPWGLCVTRENYAAHLNWLAANRTVLPLRAFAELVRLDRLPRDAVALTFDDGYASSVEAAAMLEERNLHATIFLPVELIERGQAFWWDELAEVVIGTGCDSLRVEGEEHILPPSLPADVRWRPHDRPRTPRQRLVHQLWARLRTEHPQRIEGIMADLRAHNTPETIPADQPATVELIRSSRSSALSFGAHGLTHPSLPRLGNADKVQEITESYRQCTALTGEPPASFAYPYGDTDAQSIEIAQAAGYECACATGNAFVTRRSQGFALPRQYVGNWDAPRLAAMLQGV